MNRDGSDKSGRSLDTGAAQSNNRFTSPLVINSASRRKSLFSRPKTKEEDARPTSSDSLSDANVASPNNTRIPRPAQRRPFTLSDAYRLAEEEEEAAQASPSPAPRLWQSRRESVERKTTKTGSPNTSNTPRRGGLTGKFAGARQGDDHAQRPVSQQSDLSDSTFDEKLRQYALDQTTPGDSGRRSNGALSKSRLGTRIVETGKEMLARKSSRGSLENTPSPRVAKAMTTDSPSPFRRLSGRNRESSDASSLARRPADGAQPDPNAASPARHAALFPDSQTPNRSFAWQADADFTAGDLQISNSPPVAIGRSNTRIDEIRALEAEVKGRFSESLDDQPADTRVNRIRSSALDAGIGQHDDPLGADNALMEAPETRSEGRDMIPIHRSISQGSLAMDELRSREIERLSRKALATARLDEFREKKIGVSRSPSPDLARRSGGDAIRSFSPLRVRLRRGENEAPAPRPQAEDPGSGQNTLATALAQSQPASTTANATHSGGTNGGPERPHRDSQTKDEPDNALGRVAAATSSSLVPDGQASADSQAPAARDRGGLAERARQRRSFGGAKSDARPTVGFAGLSRSSSVESRLAKRTSFVHSDSDPTERIEGEMKLFAPQENQSERGSLRAPSPEPDDEVPDETPKPIKTDPLTQPTPRVTGAFVETPATVKVEKFDDLATGPAAETQDAKSQNGSGRPTSDITAESTPLLADGGKDGTITRQHKRTQSSKGDRFSGRSSSLSARRRARSLSRGRAPLTNSARPPTVRDDLLEIQRANQIDDSTLDDIADLLDPEKSVGAILGSADIKSEKSGTGKFDKAKELEAYDRMTQALKTGLLGIQNAKQGIERLEKKVAHAEIKEHAQHTGHGANAKGKSPSCPVCDGAQPPADAGVTYVHLPIPRLWHQQPKFRFTALGLSLFLLSLWYIAESWMCFRYCKPDYCYPGAPCDWSSDDPVWGYAIPVKLDQWIAGGRGRDFTRRARPEVADWLADVWDAARGVDISAVDTSRHSWEQKRQHRRRLAKKGLSRPFAAEDPEDREIFGEWKSVREAKERAQSAQEMGYQVDEEESIADDERL